MPCRLCHNYKLLQAEMQKTGVPSQGLSCNTGLPVSDRYTGLLRSWQA